MEDEYTENQSMYERSKRAEIAAEEAAHLKTRTCMRRRKKVKDIKGRKKTNDTAEKILRRKDVALEASHLPYFHRDQRRLSSPSESPIPCVMLPYPLSPDHCTFQFFCLTPSSSSSSFFDSSPPCLDCNTYKYFRCLGLVNKTCHGLNHCDWTLVIGSGCKTPPLLINPSTGSEIPLPPFPLPTIWQQCPEYDHLNIRYEVEEEGEDEEDDDDDSFLLGPGFYVPSVSAAVLSFSPFSSGESNTTTEIMVIHGWDFRLSLCRPGDEEWTAVVDGDTGQQCVKFMSLAYAKGQFYATDMEDNIFVCNTRTSPPTAIVLGPTPKRPKQNSKCYLVGSDQELFLVIRNWRKSMFSEFSVFKFVGEEKEEAAASQEPAQEEVERRREGKEDKGEGEQGQEELWFMRMDTIEEKEKQQKEEGKWLRLDSIGERAIFICNQNSFVISTVGLVECKPSCIYYCDVFGERNCSEESSVKLLEYSIQEEKCKRMIHCSSGRSFELWQPMFFRPTSQR